MSHRNWTQLVRDILDAVATIEGYVEGMSFDEFEDDNKTVDAVIRNFIIIGEAASRVPEQPRLDHAEIPWRVMGDMRNFAVHQYWNVDRTVLWKTIAEDLPPLKGPLQRMLEGR